MPRGSGPGRLPGGAAWAARIRCGLRACKGVRHAWRSVQSTAQTRPFHKMARRTAGAG
jgi:hypothetical protein